MILLGGAAKKIAGLGSKAEPGKDASQVRGKGFLQEVAEADTLEVKSVTILSCTAKMERMGGVLFG